MTLWQMFNRHTGWDIHKWRHYFAAYESHLARFVERPVLVLEIGVLQGGSLQLWRDYLGAQARIVGIDIDESRRFLEEKQVSIRIGDQSDSGFLQSVIMEFGSPDVVIDDGSHVMSHMRASFDFLYPRMSPSGVYIVEDLHAAYETDFEGGLRRPGSFIEHAKGLIDELNADWTNGELPPTAFTRTTNSIHFYDGMVVFERGPHEPAQPVMAPPRGKMSRFGRRVVRARLRFRSRPMRTGR